jgi:cyclic pyranopterin phosphate synthase
MTNLCDPWQRQINYLRISVTDHCNLNCLYCSAGSSAHLPRNEVLSFEEIQRVVQVAATMGISKVRLTGGEPLLRSDLCKLIQLISNIESIDDISLTSNGIFLSKYAAELKKAWHG